MCSDKYQPLPLFKNAKNMDSINAFIKFIEEESDPFIEIVDPLLKNSENDLLVCNRDRYGFKLPFVLNTKSGVLRASKYYRPEVLENFYKKYYRDIYTLGSQTYFDLFCSQVALGEKIIRILGSRIHGVQSVLDFGSGVGGALIPFTDKGIKAVGVDLNSEGISWANRNFDLGLKNLSLDKLIENDNLFDLIIVNHVLEHIVDLSDFLVKIKRLLSPKGLLYISVPSLEVVRRKYRSDLRYYLQNAHLWNFSVRSFVQLIESHDFGVEWMNSDIDALISKKNRTYFSEQLTIEYEENLIRGYINNLELSRQDTNKSWNRLLDKAIKILTRMKANSKKVNLEEIDSIILNVEKIIEH
jgi:2-polyprenyl-3-methyl-5-hydroxy-6-metoxy-1,4-benzoquinol methylase